MIGVTVSCAGCSATLQVKLGERTLTCPTCGAKRKIEAAVDDRLRAHYERVKAAIDRAKTKRERPDGPAGAGRGCLPALVALALFASAAFYFTEHALAKAIGCAVLGLVIGAVVVIRKPAPGSNLQAGEVTCNTCNANVAIVRGDQTIDCAFCGSAIDLDDAAHKIRVADVDIDAAEQQIEAALRQN